MLVRKEVSALFTSSPGPFLITLDGPVRESTRASATLFADLSQYPVDTIEDVVNGYMGSLLLDFPKQRTTWKPSMPLAIALRMVWFQHEASAFVQTVIEPTKKPATAGA